MSGAGVVDLPAVIAVCGGDPERTEALAIHKGVVRAAARDASRDTLRPAAERASGDPALAAVRATRPAQDQS